ncbi:MAG TPA: HWE histidine kinase domain-containing protein [Caulobacteraceae bacterium]|jgi:PAS domain S-box-containing protein
MVKAPKPDDGAARELAVEQARATLALSAAEMGEFEWDLDRDRFIVSERMAAITGMPAGSWPGRRGEFAMDVVHSEDRDALRALISAKLTSELRYTAQYRMVRPDDGRVQWMESSAVVLRGPGGAPVRLIGIVRDISLRKAEEDARESLVAELDHRVKNVLASVQSLAAQSARKTVSLEAFLKTFTGRLEAMAAAHTLLTRTRWRGAEIGDVVAAELSGLAHGRARWSGPVVMLNPRATNALTLALHELATNAVKYGAFSTEAGRLDVRWSLRPSGGFELSWSERRGPTVEPPTRQGFGAMLLDRVTGRELGGEVIVEFLPEGLRAVVCADASALTTAPPPPAPSTGPRREAVARDGASLGDEGGAEIAGLKVLVVEDAVLLALELEAALSEAGAEVVGPAASLEEALRMLDADFDVALLDADLNGQSAAPLAEALAARGRPYILATGHKGSAGMPEDASVPVVRKPYNVRQIAAALCQATGRAQASEAS